MGFSRYRYYRGRLRIWWYCRRRRRHRQDPLLSISGSVCGKPLSWTASCL